jgi:hypothetical protein
MTAINRGLHNRPPQRTPQDGAFRADGRRYHLMNSPEFFVLLTAQRGWSPEEFEHWLAWIRLLMEPQS